MYQLIAGGPPTDNERQAVRAYVQRTSTGLESAAGDGGDAGDASDHSDIRALALACHAVFASSRFQFLE
jgi:hypothetical protein